jgi:hypothetical protein
VHGGEIIDIEPAAPAPKPAPPAPPSDPLAPLNALTPEEKIALFS